MLKLDRDTLRLRKVYSKNPRFREVTLFGFTILFQRKGKGENLYWTTETSMNYMKVAIHLKGRFTWYSIKKILEMHLNYRDSHLRRKIIMQTFK